MATTAKEWSTTASEEKFEKLTVDTIAANTRRESMVARIKTFSARVGERPLTPADAADFQALMTESAQLEGELLALRIERERLHTSK